MTSPTDYDYSIASYILRLEGDPDAKLGRAAERIALLREHERDEERLRAPAPSAEPDRALLDLWERCVVARLQAGGPLCALEAIAAADDVVRTQVERMRINDLTKGRDE